MSAAELPTLVAPRSPRSTWEVTGYAHPVFSAPIAVEPPGFREPALVAEVVAWLTARADAAGSVFVPIADGSSLAAQLDRALDAYNAGKTNVLEPLLSADAAPVAGTLLVAYLEAFEGAFVDAAHAELYVAAASILDDNTRVCAMRHVLAHASAEKASVLRAVVGLFARLAGTHPALGQWSVAARLAPLFFGVGEADGASVVMAWLVGYEAIFIAPADPGFPASGARRPSLGAAMPFVDDEF